MTIEVVDKRIIDKPIEPKAKEPVPPPWWPVLGLIDEERQRQLDKWGEQHHEDGTGHPFFAKQAESFKAVNDRRVSQGKDVRWAQVLLEEVNEALAETDPRKLGAELVQVAAVCTAWIEDIASRG